MAVQPGNAQVSKTCSEMCTAEDGGVSPGSLGDDEREARLLLQYLRELDARAAARSGPQKRRDIGR